MTTNEVELHCSDDGKTKLKLDGHEITGVVFYELQQHDDDKKPLLTLRLDVDAVETDK